MLDILKSVIKKAASKKQSGPAARPQEDDQTELQVATCAVLLEIAHADDEFSHEEEQRIEEVMQKQFNLPLEAVQEIKALSEQRRANSIDLWHFAGRIKESYSAAQKAQVIEMIWRVVYADGNLDAHEDYLVHQLAKLLDLDHRALIDAKVKVLREAGQ